MEMKILIRFVFLAAIAVLFAGCATTMTDKYLAAGREKICDGKGWLLGYTAVLPEAAWRKDQKEPRKREMMALEEIKKSFQNLPCGNLNAPGGIREFSNWSGKPESELLKQFNKEGVDTIILLRIEELTPRIFFTLSLPVLWGGSNEADFRIRALSVKSGEVLSDMRVKRYTGGPFNIRPAKWSGAELNAALHDIIEKGKME
jgi:hypothetical protein